ncbi:MAG TPA: TetR/AcrR family transcriptional regulator [Pseudonocardiaceae bacterium]|nr:TetR/AcrR family transcriptional regulator [Pseudonocardiaceae bacterium]
MSNVSETRELPNAAVDHRKAPRRRGAALYAAIFEATLDELTAVGYAELKMEHIAHRARASKGSLYRRWSSRAELVADAVHHTLPGCGKPPDTGSVRADILTCLRRFAAALNGASGEAIRGLMAETIRNPDLMEIVRIRFIDPGVSLFLDVLRHGAGRGEVRATALTSRIASVGPDLLRQHFLVHCTPIPDQVLVEIVDDVIIPLIRP